MLEVLKLSNFYIWGWYLILNVKHCLQYHSFVGLENHQPLHHFLTVSPWDIKVLRGQRLKLILDILSGGPIILIIDETGDKKKGKSTDYVKRQYIGNLGKTQNGIVAVTAYAVFCGMTFPLTFEIYKPRERLKEGDKYLTKPEIAGKMIRAIDGRVVPIMDKRNEV